MKNYWMLFAVFFFSEVSAGQTWFFPEIEALMDSTAYPFPFGVASGDPTSQSVVLWTKVFPVREARPEILWEIALDTQMQQVVQAGSLFADSSFAWTVKVEVPELKSGAVYFYRFRYGARFSPVGRTRTAPDGSPTHLKLAVVSCSDYQSGYYNTYGHLAGRNDLDAVLHLGDYIYEYGIWQNPRRRMGKNLVRTHLPPHVCTTLKDYRTRYAQYRLDPQLKEAHRLHPFIVIWDDHELANNSHVTGTDTQPQGGLVWEQRKAAARQAYFEWMPLRDHPEYRIPRHFSYGDLAELWMLDERLEARSPQAAGINDPRWQATDRYMLGPDQTQWLLEGIRRTSARWKIIGNQVVFSPLDDSGVFDRRPGIAMDRWDGYPAERQRIFDFLYENDLKNIIILTGDVHSAWAFELTMRPKDKSFYNRKTGKGSIGAEFVTPSATSFNFDEVVPKIISAEARRRFKMKKNNPHLRFLDLNRHGYLTLTLTPQNAIAEWFFVKTKKVPDSRMFVPERRVLKWNEGKIR